MEIGNFSLVCLLLLASFTPFFVRAQLQCPKGLVSVDSDGSLTFQPLPPGSKDSTPSYDPGMIGGWYSLSSGFIDVVRSGSLPYGIINPNRLAGLAKYYYGGAFHVDAIKSGLKSLNVPCSIPGLRNDCTEDQMVSTSFDPTLLIGTVGYDACIIAILSICLAFKSTDLIFCSKFPAVQLFLQYFFVH